MSDPRYRQGIIAIIVNKKNQFLLLQLTGVGKGDWNFVGGGLEPDETYDDCLWREVKEETGLAKESFELIGISKNTQRYDYHPELLARKREEGSPYIGQEKVRYVLRLVDSSDIKLDINEHSNYIWIDFPELKKYLLFPGQYDHAVDVIKELVPELI